MLTYSEIFLLFPVIVTAIWFVSFLFGKTSLRNPRFIMALFMGCALLTFLSGIGLYAGVFNLYRHIYPWVFFTALSLFPLFYIYVFEIVNPNAISKKLLWHFLPALTLLSLAISLYGGMMDAEEKQFYIEQVLLSQTPKVETVHWKFSAMNIVDKVAKFLYILLSIAYYIITLRLVHKHQQTIEDYYAALKEVSLNWVRTLGFFFVLALMSGVLVHWVHRLEVLNSELLSSLPFLFLGIFFAIVGNQSNKQNVNIFPSEKTDLDKTETIKISKEVKNETLKGEISPGSVIPSGLKEKLENYFTEYRPYLNPDLKIWDVARELNTNRTYISRLINVVYEKRFSTFVNHFRIRESKRLMTDPKTAHYSLTIIASMSGFLNYSSFVRAFKMEDGKTPNEFRQSTATTDQ